MSKKKTKKKVILTDRLIKLLDGTLLLGRLILDDKNDNKKFLYVHIPLEVFIDDYGSVFLEHWIPVSKDAVYTIQIKNVVNISQPDDELSKRYNDGFKTNNYNTPEQETLEEFKTNLDHKGKFH